MQNKVPKIDASTMMPAKWPSNPAKEWCPPGHGDLYPALAGTGDRPHTHPTLSLTRTPHPVSFVAHREISRPAKLRIPHHAPRQVRA